MTDFDFSRFRLDDGLSRNDPEPFRRELPASTIAEDGHDADGIVHQVGVRGFDGHDDAVMVFADGSRLRIIGGHDDQVPIPLHAIDELIEALKAIREQSADRL